MTIIDLQRRLAEIGRIRIGQQVATSGGRSRPAKLETFRLTSADQVRIQAAANVFGGTPRQWDAPAGRQWEVVTEAASMDVIVPPSDMAFSQWYEQWSAGGCQRRCDGQYESISEGPCVCDPERRDCAIHTRLSVLLATLPGLGVWRIDTSGYYAAVELNGAVEVIRLAAGRGQMLPARLRLEQRVVKRQENGKPVTRRFAVPVLDIDVSPTQLLSGGGGFGPRPGPQQQLDGSAAEALDPPTLTPVPESVPHRPVGTVAEQMRQLENAAPPPRRSNAQQSVPRTGLAPRTRAEADGASNEVGNHEPPDPDEDGALADQRAEFAPDPVVSADQDATPQPDPEDEAGAPVDMVTGAQMKRLQAGFTAIGVRARAQRLAITCRIIGRHIESANELYRAEAATVIDEIEERRRILAETEQPEDAAEAES